VSGAEYEETYTAVKDMAKEGGVGHTLQALLEERAKTKENWLSDWWLDVAYLAYRDPVTVWSSPGIVWPKQNFHDKDDMVRFAARAVSGALDYKLSVDQRTIPVSYSQGHPMDMQQYFQVFGTSRIPGLPKDTQSFNPQSRHIVVIYRNRFYRMEVYGESGELLSAEQIYKQMQEVLSLSPDNQGPALGLLTSLPRDSWAQYYTTLSKAGHTNVESLSVLETALFTISLDPRIEDLQAVDECSRSALLALHGGGPVHAGANRWHDKCIQLFVTETGECGMTYEHSPAEGPPLMEITDHILGYIDGRVRLGSNLSAITFPQVRHLDFTVTEEINQAIQEAGDSLHRLVTDLEMATLHFTHWGKSEIKSLGFSPDSFVQIALQLAFYRVQGEPGATYESGATRRFLHGRTETIRSCSVESVEFCRAMVEEPDTEKSLLMKAAIAAHNSYAKLAVLGLGVDRHMLGLKLIAAEAGIELPPLYSDPGYLKSGRMRISSSQVSGSTASYLCFGPLVCDGYGVCYNLRSQDMFFPCSSLHSCSETSAVSFRSALEQSLLDMRELAVTSVTRAKL